MVFLNIILDMVNYKVINCSTLFFNIDNFRHNKAVMICSTSIFISVLLLIIFFCCLKANKKEMRSAHASL